MDEETKGLIIGGLVAVLVILLTLFFVGLRDYLSPPKAAATPQVNVSQVLDNFKLRTLQASCDGIDAYYSGTSFVTDWTRLNAIYLYHTTNISTDINTVPLLPPRVLSYRNLSFVTINCNQWAFWVHCLSAKYSNVICEPYINKEITHVGMDCVEYLPNGSGYEIES